MLRQPSPASTCSDRPHLGRNAPLGRGILFLGFSSHSWTTNLKPLAEHSPLLAGAWYGPHIHLQRHSRCLQTPSRRNLMDAVGNGAGLSAWHCHPSWPAHTPVLLGRSNSTGQEGLSSWADRRSLHPCDQPGFYLFTPSPKPSNDGVHCQAGQTP